MIKEQFDMGFKQGKADARIVSRESKPCRWLNMHDITHKDDNWIWGYCHGFAEQRKLMEDDPI